jgi:hypothetical protein
MWGRGPALYKHNYLINFDILRYKAIPAAVNESNFGKTIISKYKGDF